MFLIIFSIISENMFYHNYHAINPKPLPQPQRHGPSGIGSMAQLRFPMGSLLCDPQSLPLKPGAQGISGGGPYWAIYYRAQ